MCHQTMRMMILTRRPFEEPPFASQTWQTIEGAGDTGIMQYKLKKPFGVQPMMEPNREPKVRIQLDLTATQAERFDSLMQHCDLGSRKELFNVAMSLFYWATQEASKGRKVASYDEENDHVETILVPALDHVSSQARPAKSEPTDASPVRRNKKAASVVGRGSLAVAN